MCFLKSGHHKKSGQFTIQDALTNQDISLIKTPQYFWSQGWIRGSTCYDDVDNLKKELTLKMSGKQRPGSCNLTSLAKNIRQAVMAVPCRREDRTRVRALGRMAVWIWGGREGGKEERREEGREGGREGEGETWGEERGGREAGRWGEKGREGGRRVR